MGAPLTAEEEAKYENIDFDVGEYRKDLGAPGHLIHKEDKKKTLMARWRYPSLSLHGIQGAFSDAGAKTVIPRKVTGKFSIRIVPNQTPEGVEKTVVHSRLSQQDDCFNVPRRKVLGVQP